MEADGAMVVHLASLVGLPTMPAVVALEDESCTELQSWCSESSDGGPLAVEAEAICASPLASVAPVVPAAAVSPRLADVLGVFDAPWNPTITNCVEAVSMEPDTFGGHTECIRELCIAAICEAQRGAQVLQQGSSVGTVRDDSGHACGPRSSDGSSAPPCCTSIVRACEGSLPASEAGKAPSCSMVVKSAVSSSTIMSVNLQCENDEAASLAVQLVDITPAALMFPGESAVPMSQRRDNRLSHLSTLGSDSLRAGIGTVRMWLRFCQENSLADCGLPVDSDMMQWFLNWDEKRAVAEAKGKRTGLHAK